MAKKKAAKKSAMKKGPAKKAKKKPAAKKSAAKKSMKAVARKSPARKAAKKKTPKARKRELINTGTDKRFVRRDEVGQFQDVVDVGRSLAADIRQPALFDVPAGQGDRGD